MNLFLDKFFFSTELRVLAYTEAIVRLERKNI